MSRVLLTAFEPYDCWSENSSWLALVQLTQDLPESPQVTTRLYPVDFEQVRQRLREDLAADYDFALHLGQAPGAAGLRLESIGLNVGGASSQPPESFQPLVESGPVGYRTSLPLDQWVAKLRQAGIPASISYHAGAYLCNATLYLCHYLADVDGRKTRAAFVHLPLDPSQVVDRPREIATMPSPTVAAGLRLILEELK